MTWTCACGQSWEDTVKQCGACMAFRPAPVPATAPAAASSSPAARPPDLALWYTLQSPNGPFVKFDSASPVQIRRPQELAMKLTPRRAKRAATPLPLSFLARADMDRQLGTACTDSSGPSHQPWMRFLASLPRSLAQLHGQQGIHLWDACLYEPDQAAPTATHAPSGSESQHPASAAAPVSTNASASSASAASAASAAAMPVQYTDAAATKVDADDGSAAGPEQARAAKRIKRHGPPDAPKDGIEANQTELDAIQAELDAAIEDDDDAESDAESDADSAEEAVLIKAHPDLAHTMACFDRGHLFALQLGGIDHAAQIVPQMRNCNQRTWARMEKDILGLAMPDAARRTAWRKRIAPGAQADKASATPVVPVPAQLAASSTALASDAGASSTAPASASAASSTMPVSITNASGAAPASAGTNTSTSTSGASSQGPTDVHSAFENPNTLDRKNDVVARIFVFHHRREPQDDGEHWDALERIPAWFYVQVYFVTERGALGLAHYSMANGRQVALAPPTPDQIAAFERAHASLGYPADALQRVEDGTWYPDPPYAALQHLADEKDAVMPVVTLGADAFTQEQREIIRSYNAWLNGGSAAQYQLLSDYRPAVRAHLIAGLEAKVAVYDALLKGNPLDDQQQDELKAMHDDLQTQCQRIGKEIAFEELMTSKNVAKLYKYLDGKNKAATAVDSSAAQSARKRKNASSGSSVSASAATAHAASAPVAASTAASPPATLQTTSSACWATDAARLWRCEGEVRRALVNGIQQSAVDNPWVIKWNTLFETQLTVLERTAPVRQTLDALKDLEERKADTIATAHIRDIRNGCCGALQRLEHEQPDLYPRLALSGGRDFPEVDHIKPKSSAGTNRYDNARLVSFAQNHIYRDKTYAVSSSSSKSAAAEDRSTATYEKEKQRIGQVHVITAHMAGVDRFSAAPDPRLAAMVKHFRDTHGVGLSALSDRPAAPASAAPPAEAPASMDSMVTD